MAQVKFELWKRILNFISNFEVWTFEFLAASCLGMTQIKFEF